MIGNSSCWTGQSEQNSLSALQNEYSHWRSSQTGHIRDRTRQGTQKHLKNSPCSEYTDCKFKKAGNAHICICRCLVGINVVMDWHVE